MNSKQNLHLPTNRSFGLTFVCVFSLFFFYKIFRSGTFSYSIIGLIISLALVTWLMPTLLRWPNFIWYQFGSLLQKFMGPITTALLYFSIFPATRLLAYVLGKNLLQRKFTNAPTYWVSRDESNLSLMDNQF